jgi:two-component system nitrate/nitrite response regulator NarL
MGATSLEDCMGTLHSFAAVRDLKSSSNASHRLRVIVADDTPHMLDTVTAIIESSGQVDVVATATNGIGAIRAAQRLTPDLVVLDVCMPMMSGFEAATHIKRRLPDTKVLMVSADDDPDLGLVALDCGADGFMWKRSLAAGCQDALRLLFPD